MGDITEDDVSLAGFLLEHVEVGGALGAVDELHIVVGVLLLNELCAVAVTDNEGVFQFWVGFLESIKGIAADISSHTSSASSTVTVSD